MELTADDEPLAELLQTEVLQPFAEKIINQFYDYLLQHDEMRFYIRDEDVLQRLKQTQTEYLLTLGVDFTSYEYIEYRLRVGHAHERINMPIRLYQAAYLKIQNLIVDSIPQSIRQNEQQLFPLLEFVRKIIAYDMSLAIDVYHLVRIDDMTQSIDHLKHERDDLAVAVDRDVLTGAYSRRYILEFLKHKLAELRRDHKQSFCLAMLDLDHFKKVNDNYGHVVGDHVLQRVVDRVMTCIREVDQFGRYGGEEFILILPNSNLTGGINLAERIRQSIADKTIDVQGKAIPITISIGICQANKDDTPELLIERADSRLYEAKKQGRNRVVSG